MKGWRVTAPLAILLREWPRPHVPVKVQTSFKSLNIKVLCDNDYDQANKLKLRQ